MSKERARRRVERLAAAEALRASRDRRRRWAARLSRLDPRVRRRRRGRTGKLFSRRTRPQRSAIATGVLIALVLVWLYVDSLGGRVALTILIAVTTPAVVVLTLDRRI